MPTYDMVGVRICRRPGACVAEMLEVVGRVVDHDDSVNDRWEPCWTCVAPGRGAVAAEIRKP